MTIDRVFDCQYDIADLERQFTAEFGKVLKDPSGVFHQMLQTRCKPPEDEPDYDEEPDELEDRYGRSFPRTYPLSLCTFSR